jgi:hypothetical protein
VEQAAQRIGISPDRYSTVVVRGDDHFTVVRVANE